MLFYLTYIGLSFALAVICVFVLALQMKKFIDLRKEYGEMKNASGPIFDEYLELRRKAGAFSALAGVITIACLIFLSLLLRADATQAFIELIF